MIRFERLTAKEIRDHVSKRLWLVTTNLESAISRSNRVAIYETISHMSVVGAL